MKDYINKNIKESFSDLRSGVLEKSGNYFNCSNYDKYMTRCCSASELAKSEAPSSVHIDNTSRVQFVSENESSRLIYQLLDNFENEYGIKVLINP